MSTPGTNPQTSRVMAYLLDISPRRLLQLADEGVVKPLKRGSWDLVATLHGYLRYLRDGQKGPSDSHDARRERARLLKAQADRAELETDILRAETIPAEVVKDVWSQIIGAVRARLLALPNRLAVNHAALVDYPTTERLTRALVDEALNELAEFEPDLYRSARARAAGLTGRH